MTAFLSKGDSDADADKSFIQDSIRELDRSPVLLLASHGYPDGLVGGLKASDIRRVDLRGTVALNIACYNGVTSRWFEDDWTTGKVKERQVASEDSFCLAAIDSGVAGYIAYSCPRPAGPILFGDAVSVCTQGITLGELRRRDSNRIVLAHLMAGHNRLQFQPTTDGDDLPRGRTPAATVQRMSVGGMLIGDPAFVPFRPQSGLDPVLKTVNESEKQITVDVQLQTPAFHFFAGEQINYWNGRSPALRLETAVEIGNRTIDAVKLTRSPIEGADYKLVAAVDTHEGRRILHIKAVFQQPEGPDLQRLAMGGFGGQFTILTGSHSSKATENPIIIRESSGDQ
jgi:hypothetical protein